MNKNLVLCVSLLSVTLQAKSEMPDYCKSGAYTCYQSNSNTVIVYPVAKAQTHHHIQSRESSTFNENHYKTGSNTFYGKDTIGIDLSNRTWSAFDDNGSLLRSGPISAGKDYCPDTGSNCETITGTFTIYRKGDETCKSTRFPVGKGGAPMPYCMFFHGGFAIHGARSVPNYNVSHGCVRMSLDDAQWLNQEFVQEGLTQVHVHY